MGGKNKEGNMYLAPEEGKDEIRDDINGSIKQPKEEHKNGKEQMRHAEHVARHC